MAGVLVEVVVVRGSGAGGGGVLLPVSYPLMRMRAAYPRARTLLVNEAR